MKVITLQTGIYICMGVIIGMMMSSERVPERRHEEKKTCEKVVRHIVEKQIHTRYTNNDFDFERIGHLHASERIIPLFGRQVRRGSDMWHYYTMSDGQIPVRLSFMNGGRSSNSEYGCKELYDGDNVFIEEYNRVFAANIQRDYLRYNGY